MVAIGAVVASIYAVAAIDFPSGSGTPFAIILLSVSIVTNIIGEVVEQIRLTTLRKLSAGSLVPTVEALEVAARESAAAPNVSFWVVIVGFSFASIATAVLWWAIARPPPSSASRVAFIGCLVAPLSAMTAHLVMLPRGRAMLRVLVSAGLPAERLYQALAPTFALRRRLMVYAAIAVVTPMALVTDMSLHRASRLAARVATLSADDATAMFLAERNEGLVPLAVLAAVVLIMVVACAWLSGHALGAPMRELAVETERLARGEYGSPSVVPSELEVWAVARALAMMESRLVVAMKQLDETTIGITRTTDELVSGGNEQTAGLTEQTLSLAATTATTGELARSAKQIAGNAQNVSALARQTFDVARSGQASASAFAAAMQQVRSANQAIADSVVRLNKRVQQVGKVVEFIDGIADKSDLLALNAELEGSKAGEVGQGFGSIAAEMRRLAESVMSSTREIVALIADIRDSTNAAVMATEAGVKATEAGTGLAQQVRDGLARIVEFANHSSEAMGTISTATAQQESGTNQLSTVMADILRSTDASFEASKTMTLTNAALARLAGELKQSLEKLQVKS